MVANESGKRDQVSAAPRYAMHKDTLLPFWQEGNMETPLGKRRRVLQTAP